MAFVRKRVLRLWPAHLVVMAALAVLIGLSDLAHIGPNRPGWYLWADWPIQALLLQAWGGRGGGGWNLPSWSLSALLACYVLFPALWRLQRKATHALAPVLCAFGLLAAAAGVSQAWLHMAFYDLPFNDGVFRAAPLFIVGASLARLTQDHRLRSAAALACLAGGGAALIALQSFGRYDFASMVAIAAIIVGAGSLRTTGSRLTATAARISFSLFITHALSAAVWFGALHAAARGAAHDLVGPVGWLIWCGGMGFAVCVAFVFDRFVDQPIQTQIRRQPRAPPRGWSAVDPALVSTGEAR